MPKICTDFSISSILNLGQPVVCKKNGDSKEIEQLQHNEMKESHFEMENMQLSSLSDSSSNSPPRKKKTRTVFTRQQIQHLENAFDRKKYFTNTERQKLASDLMLSETQVKIWLQNRRNKWKKQIHSEPASLPYIQTNYAPLIREHLHQMETTGDTLRKDGHFLTSSDRNFNDNRNFFISS